MSDGVYVEITTQAKSLDIYLSINGNDSTGSGSQTNPIKTMAKAKQLVMSYEFLDTVRIYLMTPGSYPAVDWDGARFIGNTVRPGRLAIIALNSTRIVAVSGTVLAGSTVLQLNTSSIGALDTHIKKFLVRKNAAGVILDERIIITHTDTTITPSHGFVTVPVVGETFEIVLPGVTITGAIVFTNFYAGIAGDQTANPVTTNAASVFAAGAFLINIHILDCFVLYNTFCYIKGCSIVSKARVFDNSRLMLGMFAEAPTYYGTTALSFLGIPHDGVWMGAGLVGDRLDAPVTGIIEGYIGLNVLITAYSTSSGSMIIRGGVVNGAGSGGYLIAFGALCSLIIAKTSDWTKEGNTPMPIPLRLASSNKGGIDIYSPLAKLYISACTFAVSLHCVYARKGSSVVIDNITAGNISGGTTGPTSCGVVALENAKVLYYNNPVLLGGAGGGADNRIADAVVVNQPNSFFATTGAVMGPSAQGTMILRASGTALAELEPTELENPPELPA